MTDDLVFQALRRIIIHEMELDGDRVNIYNQKFTIPTDDNLFVYIEPLPSTTISNRNTVRYDPTSAEYQEIQDLNTRSPYSIGVFSKNRDALNRKEEVLMALNSVYSQQQQELYSFRIFPNMPINDVSELEGAARLYRFDIQVIIFVWTQKIKKVDFYDTFGVEVNVNDGSDLLKQSFTQPHS